MILHIECPSIIYKVVKENWKENWQRIDKKLEGGHVQTTWSEF